MKWSIFWVAVLSRVFLIILQFIANHLIPDHNAGVFVSPQRDEEKALDNPFDRVVELSLGGFRRWDAQYFLHIAEYGYTYENTLAFFPLFPLCVRILGQLLLLVLPIFSLRSILLLSATALNVIFFARAAQTLYELSYIVFGSKTRAKIAALLFCVNPASVFFTAPYSESLYCWLSLAFFKGCLQGISVHQTFPLSLSIVCRSNALMNVIYLVYWSLQGLVRRCNVTTFLATTFKSAIIIFFVLFHFGLLNAYHYYLFCHHPKIKFPAHIIEYAQSQAFVLAGNKTSKVSPWCKNTLPMAYGYVQDHYWNVGFLRYFTWEQTPNFLLAAPVILVILWNFIAFVKRNRHYSLSLGVFAKEATRSAVTKYDQMSFVFLVHATALVIFSTLCIHVQVTTRMVSSSNPILYWLAANAFKFPKTIRPERLANIPDKNENKETLKGKPKIYSLDDETDEVDLKYLWKILMSTGNNRARAYSVWFVGYATVGTVLFSNFLPWT